MKVTHLSDLHSNSVKYEKLIGHIKYKLPDAVSMLGKEITTLVNQQSQPGTYETDWDA